MKVDYVHKDTTTDENIRKEFSDVIYPTMVIRSQTETIELQEKEIERLNNIINEFEKILKEEKTRTRYANDVERFTAYDYMLKRLQELNEVIKSE